MLISNLLSHTRKGHAQVFLVMPNSPFLSPSYLSKTYFIDLYFLAHNCIAGFFLMLTIFKFFIEFVTILLLFFIFWVFFFFSHEACRILVP